MERKFSLLLVVLFAGLSACQKADISSRVPQSPSDDRSLVATAQAASLPPGFAADPNIYVSLAKKVVPSVVNISTAKAVKSPFAMGSQDDIFRRFFEDFGGPGFGFGSPGGPMMRRPGPRAPSNPKNLPKAVSLGTGFIVDASGLILTNNHVVADADEIKISFSESPDEKPTDGEVVGRDSELDVALIRVHTKKTLTALTLGDSDALEVGEYVMAVGNPFGQGHSVSHGIISAKERSVPGLGGGLSNYLQTDAPINPGNSGGPLVNLKGDVIGINNAILANAQGIGFAIPSSAVQKVLSQLKNKGSVDRGYIGAVIGQVTPDIAEKLGVDPDLRAPFVTNVAVGGPADKAGIKAYDVILSINSKSIHSPSELVSSITAIPVGDRAKVRVSRNGKEMEFDVRVTKRPDGGRAQSLKKESARPSRPDIGMDLESLTPEVTRRLGIPGNVKGVAVTAVEPGSPADKAGLNSGDVLVEVDRKAIGSPDDFYGIVKDKRSYLLRVLKNAPGEEVYAVVVLDLKD